MAEVNTTIFFPLGKGGKGNNIERSLLKSKDDWVINTLKKHHLVPSASDARRCNCKFPEQGPRMQVWKHGNGNLYLKRNPDTGKDHHPLCESFGDKVKSLKTHIESAISIQDGKKNISGSNSLKISNESRSPKGENGGRQRSNVARKRANLEDCFHFIWEESGLNSQKEGINLDYKVINDAVNNASAKLKYNGTLLRDVLILPNNFCMQDQRQLMQDLSMVKVDKKAETKLILIALLNKVEKETSSKHTLRVYNGAGKNAADKFSYFIDEKIFIKASKELNIINNKWEFTASTKGKVWVCAILEPKISAKGNFYGSISEISFIPVSNEHVPI